MSDLLVELAADDEAENLELTWCQVRNARPKGVDTILLDALGLAPAQRPLDGLQQCSLGAGFSRNPRHPLSSPERWL